LEGFFENVSFFVPTLPYEGFELANWRPMWKECGISIGGPAIGLLAQVVAFDSFGK
jgi:hypothetical protein